MIRVQADPFDVAKEVEAFTNAHRGAGAIVTFSGKVRTTGERGILVKSMTIEHYPGMTEKEVAAIDAEALRRWHLQGTLILHRYGRLNPGETIVLVATAASHRAEAFDACEFLMDWLKTKAPFWKMEESEEGEHWVEAHAADKERAKRWEA